MLHLQYFWEQCAECSKTLAKPGEILFGIYRRQALLLLLLRQEERFHVREIYQLTGIPASDGTYR